MYVQCAAQSESWLEAHWAYMPVVSVFSLGQKLTWDSFIKALVKHRAVNFYHFYQNAQPLPYIQRGIPIIE
jgi:hypothetical protein